MLYSTLVVSLYFFVSTKVHITKLYIVLYPTLSHTIFYNKRVRRKCHYKVYQTYMSAGRTKDVFKKKKKIIK